MLDLHYGFPIKSPFEEVSVCIILYFPPMIALLLELGTSIRVAKDKLIAIVDISPIQGPTQFLYDLV